jgi:uncharacterized protein (UPF0332 family)
LLPLEDVLRVSWLAKRSQENLRAAEKLLGFQFHNGAANRLWYCLYHACWHAMEVDQKLPAHYQPNRPDRWKHETFTGAVMKDISRVQKLGWAQQRVHRLLQQVRAMRVDADYKNVVVPAEKLRDRYSEVQKFVQGVIS